MRNCWVHSDVQFLPHTKFVNAKASLRVYDDDVIVSTKHDVVSLLIHSRPISKRDLKTVKERSSSHYISACERITSPKFFYK